MALYTKPRTATTVRLLHWNEFVWTTRKRYVHVHCSLCACHIGWTKIHNNHYNFFFFCRVYLSQHYVKFLFWRSFRIQTSWGESHHSPVWSIYSTLNGVVRQIAGCATQWQDAHSCVRILQPSLYTRISWAKIGDNLIVPSHYCV